MAVTPLPVPVHCLGGLPLPHLRKEHTLVGCRTHMMNRVMGTTALRRMRKLQKMKKDSMTTVFVCMADT